MTARLFLPLVLLGAAQPVPSPVVAAAQPDPARCDNRPVVMIVEGDIKDAKRLANYAEGIRNSGLYQRLGGYYLVNPRPLATFEGSAPATRSILAVRFPCFAHARAFWNSRLYRETLVPLRSNPSAGDFTVTVHLELAPPPYMNGRVTTGEYRADTVSMTGIDQISQGRR